MKHTVATFIFLTFFTMQGIAQENFAMPDDGVALLREKPKVSYVTETFMYYNTDDSGTQKIITVLDNKQRPVSTMVYNRDKVMVARTSTKYDADGLKVISRKTEKWDGRGGHSSETSSYQYDDKGYLVKIVDRGDSKQIIRETVVTNDQSGKAQSLEVKSNGGNGVDNRYGVASSETVRTVKLHKDSVTAQYNEFGDLAQQGQYQYEYKYDSHNNWTTKKVYSEINGKRTKEFTISREIKYAG